MEIAPGILINSQVWFTVELGLFSGRVRQRYPRNPTEPEVRAHRIPAAL